MVYAKVFDMLINPENYEGKKIHMRGAFNVFEYEMDGAMQRSFACIIKDATACCAQGMEFVLKNPPAYPAGYPNPDTQITVTGTFHQTEQNGLTRIFLADSTLN